MVPEIDTQRSRIAELCRLDLKSDLESLFGRPMDLVELGAMPDTRLKRSIDRAKFPVSATTA
jgi:predicted nucleotidyltransferase